MTQGRCSTTLSPLEPESAEAGNRKALHADGGTQRDEREQATASITTVAR